MIQNGEEIEIENESVIEFKDKRKQKVLKWKFFIIYLRI